MKSILLTTSLILLIACAETPLVVGQPGPALAGEEVSIYFAKRPRCDFETIAHLRITGGYFTMESMVKKMRSEAAELGANGLYVLETRQLENREYLATAKAIRCLSA